MDRFLRVDQAIDRAAETRPDKVALICGDRRWTYAALRAERDRRAGVLIDAGLRPGDRLLLAERTGDDYVLAFLACARAGGIFAMLSPLLAEPELVALAGRLGPRLACTATGTHLPGLPAPPTLPLALPGTPSDAALREAAHRAATINADAPFLIRATSGTTGQGGKLVVRPHRQMTWRCGMNPWPASAESIFCCPATNQLMPSETVRTFALGATLVVPRTVGNYPALEQELAAQGVTVILATPALLGALVRQEAPPPPGFRLEVVRTIGAALPPEVKQLAEARYAAPVFEEYGMAECAGIMRAQESAVPPGSVGRPTPGVELRLLDGAGHAVPEGAIGELIVRSPGLMLGYFGDPAATAEVMRDGWLHTGDNARRDADGFYYLVGRRGLSINVGGMKVSPEEVETVLEQHPGVREAVALPQPHRTRGEVVRAIVVPRGEAPSAQELRRFCRTRLAGYKVPRAIEFRYEPLPRSALGKVLRQQV